MKRVTLWMAIITGLMLFSLLTAQARRGLIALVGGSTAQPQAVAAQAADKAAPTDSAQSKATVGSSRARAIATRYIGAQASMLAENEAPPLALASGEFNSDRATDVIAAYRSPNGGLIALHRGRQRADQTTTLFEAEAEVFSVPDAPDFIGAGDFDDDGKTDLITAARGGRALYLLAGDGEGHFKAAAVIELPGAVTAMTTGEINRLDGLAEIAVAVASANGPKLLLFAGADGAANAQPESLALTAEATSLKLGRLDDDHLIDLVAATGRSLQIVHGWEQSRGKADTASIERIALNGRARAVAIGDFTGSQTKSLAVLGEDGSVQVLERASMLAAQNDEQREAARQATLRGRNWTVTMTSEAAYGLWAGATPLFTAARNSDGSRDELLVGDALGNRLQFLSGAKRGWSERAAKQANEDKAAIAEKLSAENSVSLSGKAVAALAMGAGHHGLVILQSGKSAPVLINDAAENTDTVEAVFNVTTTAAAGAGSLRQAILDANTNPGTDTITFALASGSTIDGSNLPAITDTVIMTAPLNVDLEPTIAVNGSGGGSLVLTVGNNVISGLALFGFNGDAITIRSNGNRIENNFIGTNLAGNAKAGNGLDGINLSNSSNNIIQFNVISGNNGNGVSISGVSSEFNTIISNAIGTNVDGNAAVGNALCGVVIANSVNNTVRGNALSGNGTGVCITQALSSGNLVTGNALGTSFTGTAALPNLTYGVLINQATNNTIGSATLNGSNLISGNMRSGVFIGSNATGNLVQNNAIGTTLNRLSALPNGGDGVEINNGLNNTVGGIDPLPCHTLSVGNLISGNRGHGVNIHGLFSTTNVVQGNWIGLANDVDATMCKPMATSQGIPNLWYGVRIAASNNLVGGTVEGAGNQIAFNKIGVYVEEGDANAILRNQIFANEGLGIDLAPIGVNPNAGCKTSGANQQQAYPVLTGITYEPLEANTDPLVIPTAYIYNWRLESCSFNSPYRIEYFSNDKFDVDPTCFGEGEMFIAAQEVTTNAQGVAMFSFKTSTPYKFGLAATATDVKKNTSEFSKTDYADLVIIKKAPESAGQCDVITYSFEVTNNGPKDIQGIEVIDAVPVDSANRALVKIDSKPSECGDISSGRIKCNFSSVNLAKGGKYTFEIKVRPLDTLDLNVAPLTNPFNLVNRAAVRGLNTLPAEPDRSNNVAGVTTTLTGAADLAITEAHCPTIGNVTITGNDLEYTFTVRNAGPSTATKVKVVDRILPGATLISRGGTGWTCASTGDPFSGYTITCELATGIKQNTEVSSLKVRVIPVINGQIRNRATVEAFEKDCNLANNAVDSVVTAKEQLADLGVTSFQVNPTSINAGSSLTYNATVTNINTQFCPVELPPNLSTTATQTTLTFSLPPGSTYTGGDARCSQSGNSVVCNIGSMALGSSKSVSFNVLTNQAGAFTSSVSVLANEFDPVDNNNTASQNLTVNAAADLGVVRLDAPAVVTAGCNFDYNVVIANSGPSNSDRTTLTTTLPAGVSALSANPSQGSCAISGNTVTCSFGRLILNATASVTVTATTSNAGAINIAAAVNGDAFDGNTSNASLQRSAQAQTGDTRLLVSLEGGGNALEFGSVTARNNASQNPVARTFVVENPGCAPVTLSYNSLRRVGADVTNGNIAASKADDSVNFQVRLINAINPDDAGTLFTAGQSVRIEGGRRQRFRVLFNPVVPEFAGSNSALSATQVLPDVLTSLLTLSQPGLNDQVTVNLTGRVSNVLQIIPTQAGTVAAEAVNVSDEAAAESATGNVRVISSPRIGASLNATNALDATQATSAGGPVFFQREGNDFRVAVSIYNAGLDVKNAVYQFLDANGKQVDDLVSVDLASSLAQAKLVRGQSFTVSLKFAGGTSRDRITGVNVTVLNTISSSTGSSFATLPGPTTVSAANYVESLASDSIVAAFGQNLASGVAGAATVTLPTSLNGTSVAVVDAAGVERAAPLFFVSPNQVNYQIPAGTASGLAKVRIRNNGAETMGMIQVNDVAPGLFTANSSGEGAPAGYLLRVLPSGAQISESVARFDAAQNKFTLQPINLGADNEQVFLVLFGTGIRNGGNAVKAKIGGLDAEVIYAGSQGGFVGLDQINLRVPRALFGRGEVEVIVSANGRFSNPIRVSVR